MQMQKKTGVNRKEKENRKAARYIRTRKEFFLIFLFFPSVVKKNTEKTEVDRQKGVLLLRKEERERNWKKMEERVGKRKKEEEEDIQLGVLGLWALFCNPDLKSFFLFLTGISTTTVHITQRPTRKTRHLKVCIY